MKPPVATFYVFQNADKKNVMYNQSQGSLFGQRLGTISDFEQGNSFRSGLDSSDRKRGQPIAQDELA